MRTLLVALAMLVGLDATAQEMPRLRHVFWDDSTPHNWANLRVGGTTGQGYRRPQVCAEISPLSFLSAEACGNGSGFLHHDPEPEIAHFRGKLGLASLPWSGGWLQPHVGVGIAELQLGDDETGFSFGGTNAAATSTAGPEAGASLRGVMSMWSGFELMVEVRAYLAWLPYARQLRIPQQPLQPTLGFAVGAGF